MPLPRLIVIGGGARSGKSAFALAYARRLGPRRLFVATAEAGDDEMRARIARHQDQRGPDFETREAPRALAEAVAAAPADAVVLVDCLTLWLSNLLLDSIPTAELLGRVEALVGAAGSRSAPTLIVTNEVGLGVVPDTPLGRTFRDLAGLAHQRLVQAADETYGAFLGLILRLHPGPVVTFRPGETPR